MDRKLILESGEVFSGIGFGADCERVCELVFNTSMVGYQEILSDPSYTYQAVVMTYPLIGNYGMAREDYETLIPSIGGLIVGEYNDSPSNYRSVGTLGDVMKLYGIPGIQGVDTRRLTRSVRDLGSRKALITDGDTQLSRGLQILADTAIPTDAVERVSCKAMWSSCVPDARYRVAAIDCGMKSNIVRSLNRRGCDVFVLPHDTSGDVIARARPDGVLVSNGPGDPCDAEPVIETVRAIAGRYPMMGICLGHQIISLAYGASTYKLKFGHRGGNHPVKNLITGKIEITSQNHSYAVDRAGIAGTGLEITHVNLLDGTVEGVRHPRDKVICVQYHPESAPGPEDSGYLFDEFITLMVEGRNNA